MSSLGWWQHCGSALCSDDIPIIMADDVVCRRRGSGGADGHHREPGPGPERQPGPRPRAAVAGSRAGVAPPACFSESAAGEWGYNSTCQLVELAWLVLVHLTCRLPTAEPYRNRPFHLARLLALACKGDAQGSAAIKCVHDRKRKHHQMIIT